jgi:nicotinate-nucleotide adenylyltransferase
MNLGIFGGSFDPVHLGHLAVARACQLQAALDEVWFVPAAVQPLKRSGPEANDDHRVEMLKLALDGKPNWLVCRLELDRGGYSYTFETLRQIHEELPEATLFFMIGADAVRDLPRWKEPSAIFAIATPLVVRRAGESEPDFSELSRIASPERRARLVEMPAMDVSSSDIRRRVAQGDSIAGLVPPTVGAYIAEHGLYRS